MSESRTKIEEAMTHYWGERCAEHEPNCPSCDAWVEFDERIRPERINSAALDELAQIDRELIDHTDATDWRNRCERAEAALAERTAEQDALAEAIRREARASELSAGIMRDARRTGGWSGAENTARAFDRIASRLRAALAKHKEGE